MRPPAAAAPLVLLAACAFAHPASAGVLTKSTDDSAFVAEYRGSPGEVNTVSVGTTSGQIVVRDATAPVTAGDGCTARSPNEAVCQWFGGRIEIRVGDRDDQVTADPGTGGIFMNGQAGADVLRGDSQGDTLAGGRGADTLIGGGGDDFLQDRGAGEADTFDGGTGQDAVAYDGRSSRVLATLGAGGEDTMRAIESVTGGRGSDLLTGGPGKDILAGGSGADRLEGGGGRDLLIGGLGADRLFGGPGADDLSLGGDVVGDREADSIRCGPGRDTVADSDARDLLPPDCEIALLRHFRVVGGVRRVGAGAVRVRFVLVRGTDEEFDPTEYGRLELSRGGKRLAVSRVIRRDGNVRIALNSLGRRVVRRGTRVTLHDLRSVARISVRIR
jgi:hypothetical protein